MNLLFRLSIFGICGFFTLFACAKANDSSKEKSEENMYRQKLLESMVFASETDSKKSSDLLLIHGPLQEDEIPYLQKQTTHSDQNARYQATSLLTLVRPNESLKKREVLRQLVKNPPDLLVFATALHFFLEQPDSKEGESLALAQVEWVQKALASKDPRILGVGIAAGHLLHLKEATPKLANHLLHPDSKVREAVLDSLKQSGAGSLEPELIKILLNPPKFYYDLTSVYQILSQSNDPSMAEVFKKALSLGNQDQESAFSNGIFFSKSRKPWLKTLLLDLMKNSEKMNWSAFGRLTEWGPQMHQDLVQFCLENYTKVPASGSLERRRAVIDLEPCREFLAKLAGREKFGITEQDTSQAILFAKTWLANHK